MEVEQIVNSVVDSVRDAGLVQVEVSARHVHLDKKCMDILFGEGHTLTPKRELSQPGQYLSEERVDVIGPKGSFKHVAVLGPERPHVQVEVSISDCFTLGITAPIRQSGDTKGSASVTLVGPNGQVTIDEGAIVALRHVHMTPDDAERLGLVDNQIVSVEVLSEDRSCVFNDVVIRVSPKFRTRMHVDTDEAGAAHISGFALGKIIK